MWVWRGEMLITTWYTEMLAECQLAAFGTQSCCHRIRGHCECVCLLSIDDIK